MRGIDRAFTGVYHGCTDAVCFITLVIVLVYTRVGAYAAHRRSPQDPDARQYCTIIQDIHELVHDNICAFPFTMSV